MKKTAESKKPRTTIKRSPVGSFGNLLELMDLVIATCESVLAAPDLIGVRWNLKRAKQNYGRVLQESSRFAMTSADCFELEARSIRLEEIISQLEARVHAGCALMEPSGHHEQASA